MLKDDHLYLFNFKGFAVSALASNWERLGKPFNPLLGETYELQRPEFRIVCEQVMPDNVILNKDAILINFDSLGFTSSTDISFFC
jgi:hypothetical protein